MSTDQESKPLIEFPCHGYPIKVLGEAFDGFSLEVLRVMQKHAELTEHPSKLNPSRNGRFVSLTVSIIATGEPQLKAIHEDLKVLSFVKMVM